MSTLSNLINQLITSGVAASVAQTAATTIMSNSPNSAVGKCCAVILANTNNPTVILDECKQMAEIPNLPSIFTVTLIPALAAAAQANPVNALGVTQIVDEMEKQIGLSGGPFGIHVGGF